MLSPKAAGRNTSRASNCGSCGHMLCTFLPSDPGQVLRHRHILKRGNRLDSAEGETCLKFWVVIAGTAASCTAFEDGRRQIVGLEARGEALCSLMAGPGTQNWLEALSDCVVCEIDLSSRARELHGNPAFLAATFHVVHRRLERTQRHITTLGRLDSTERVTLFLAEMAVRAGSTDTDPRPVSLPMSREDIADYLGLNAETVSRILTRLRKSRLVKFLTPSEFLVPDLGELGRRLPVDIPDAASFAPSAIRPGPSVLHEVPR